MSIWHFAGLGCKIATMNWNDLSALVAVSRTRTMKGAAKQLGVDQTTVSRRIRALEAAIDVKLVVRHRDGVELTDAGREAARSGEVIETIIHDLERNLAGVDTELAGRLRVTTLDMMPQYHPDLFSSFSAHYPAVELEIETNATRRSLARREADVALRWTHQPDPGLFGRKLGRAEYALYASKALHESMRAGATIAAYPWLAFTADSGAVLTERFMEELAPEATIACRYSDALSMHAALRAGAGIGFMPCPFADPDPELVRLRDVEPDFGYDIWCLTHPDLRATGRVRAFLAHAGAYLDARKDLYAGRAKPGGQPVTR